MMIYIFRLEVHFKHSKNLELLQNCSNGFPMKIVIMNQKVLKSKIAQKNCNYNKISHTYSIISPVCVISWILPVHNLVLVTYAAEYGNKMANTTNIHKHIFIFFKLFWDNAAVSFFVDWYVYSKNEFSILEN